jgi:Holliday junction resolvasome RuvABC DNA-binding subunit
MLAAPVANIARAIELGDIKFLQSLPGVGATKARDIVNALRGKVSDLAGVTELAPAAEEPVEPAIHADVMAVLVQLGYSLSEARQRVRAALTRRPDLTSADDLLAEALSDRG